MIALIFLAVIAAVFMAVLAVDDPAARVVFGYCVAMLIACSQRQSN